MTTFDREVPDTDTEIRVYNTDDSEVFWEGTPTEVRRMTDDDDDSVYIEFLESEPPNKNLGMLKVGYWDSEPYNWLRVSNYGGPEVERQGEWDYEVL